MSRGGFVIQSLLDGFDKESTAAIKLRLQSVSFLTG
jgi:hypothetical protein